MIIPISLIQPLKGLVPALPAVRVGSEIRGGNCCGNCGNGSARRGYGKTGGTERGERRFGTVRAWGMNDGGRGCS